MESVGADVKDEPRTEFVAVRCVKQEWAEDLETLRDASNAESLIGVGSFQCFEQDMISLPGPVKQEPATDIESPQTIMTQNGPNEGEVAYVDYKMLVPKVELNDEIAVEDHMGDGSKQVPSSTWDGVPASCSSANDSSHSTQFPKEIIEISDEMTYRNWKFDRNEGISSRVNIDDRVTHIGRSVYHSKVFCDFASRQSGHTARIIKKCTECDKCFRTTRSLKLHLKIHTGQRDYKCTVCGKCFTQSSGLKYHLKIHSGEKDYVCGECGKCFTTKSTLKQHLKIHSGEKDHKCAECGKCFTHSSDLKKHLKIHSGEKDHKCGECGKCFTHYSSLKDHLKIHSGEKDHKCEECGKRFTQSSGLRYHLKLHSGGKNFNCEKCGKSFIDKNSLRQHLNTHSDKKELQDFRMVEMLSS